MSTSSESSLDLSEGSLAQLLRDYAPLDGTYDEMMRPDGAPRPHWRGLLSDLSAMPPDELEVRWGLAERLIHENGISYDLFADPERAERPWQFDGIPLMIAPEEWREIAAGLTQRARVLNAVLADAYGPQELLRGGYLPPSLVLGNPRFLRPCHGIEPKNGTHLHFYAADLARGPDGRWWVLGDHCESPGGVGYALENRIVMGHALPEIIRQQQTQRIAGFFQQMHDNLVRQTGREDPRVVLLTCGPGHDTFFGNAYKARYLGYSLVEGGDLTVRSDKVYLKTVEGLMPVDVIIRRIESDEADPLVLTGGAGQGVAGLVQAARQGNVVMANALGSGVAENPALMAFMPALCRQVLGEDPKLDNIATWWCGQENARAHVEANLASLFIERTFAPTTITEPSNEYWIGPELGRADRERVLKRIRAMGHAFTGQELVSASTMPVWEDGRLRPRPVVLRVFLAATEDGYAVMPGGVARIAENDDTRALSARQGDRSKDCWVPSEGNAGNLSLLRSQMTLVNLRRTGKDLPSRAADNLFWLGRYAERAEGTMRLVRTVLARLAEERSMADEFDAMSRLTDVLAGKAAAGGVAPAPAAQGSALRAAGEDLDAAARALEARLYGQLFDPDEAYGLYATLGHLRRTAALVRDRLSLDAWQVLNAGALERPWQRRSIRPLPGMVLDNLTEALRVLSAFSGLEMENMTRSHGWRFLEMGRRIERAVQMSEMLRGLLVDADEAHDPALILLLEVADSFMTYRSRYLSTPMLAPVLDLLVLDESNPRSLAFQLVALQGHVDSLPRPENVVARTPAQRIALAELTELRLADIEGLCQTDEEGRREVLDSLLVSINDTLPSLSELIARAYFSHAETTQTGAFAPIQIGGTP